MNNRIEKAPSINCETFTHEVSVRPAKQTGQGVFANRAFQTGEIVIVSRPVAFFAERTIYSLQVEKDRHVDLDMPAHYVNHACMPTTGVRRNVFGGYDFIALRYIASGEEITFNYQTTEETIMGFETCLCGSQECQGTLRGFAQLPTYWRECYPEFIAAYLLREK